jgi:hypothetical protein
MILYQQQIHKDWRRRRGRRVIPLVQVAFVVLGGGSPMLLLYYY